MTFEQLQQMLKNEGLVFFVAPDRPLARFLVGGLFGHFDVVVHVEDEGRFLQFRTVNYLACPADHKHLAAVLRVLAAINFRKRLVKFGWDESDGEIVGYADHWVMDNQVTQEQFKRMLANFLPSIDEGYYRIKAALDTGKDPGEEAAMQKLLAGQAAAGGSLPAALRELLDKLAKGGKKGKKDAEPGAGEGGEPIKEI